jgi:prepilin-type processing-associated H-X9-DG protein/prepilin-type N-terminal cleavage/methylation domain-containing protein
MTKNKKAFTLVELLVVIGVVALLISILLPALNKARRAANSVACGSNMRQVGQALFIYANDHQGRLPYAGITFDSGNHVTWDGLLFQYLGSDPAGRIALGGNIRPLTYGPNNGILIHNPPQVLLCSEDQIPRHAFLVSPAGTAKRSYALNGHETIQTGTGPGGYIHTVTGVGGAVRLDNSYDQTYVLPGFRAVRMSQIRKSSQKIMLLEYHHSYNGSGLQDNSRVVGASNATWVSQRNPHGNTSNFLFCDGHVAAVSKFEMHDADRYWNVTK